MRFLLAGLLVTLSVSSADAQNFFFISQNMIHAGHESEFEAYQDTVRPIMGRYGATYVSTSLVAVLAGDDAPQIVNFGDMGPPEQVQGFFGDPEFQAAYPALMAALDDHLAFGVDADLEAVTSLESGTLILMATAVSDADLEMIGGVDGVELLETREVVMATRGLGLDAVAETPPGVLVLWTVAPEVLASQLDLESTDTAFLLRIR